MPNDSIVTQCITCEAPLGQDSRDAGFPVCHEHRRCAACKFDVSIPEIEYCLAKQFPIKHARCLVLSDAQGPFAGPALANVAPEASIELMNLATLLIAPDMNLSVESHEALAAVRCEQLVINMTLEQKFLFMRTMQACAARMSLLLRKDKVAIQEELKARSKVKAQAVMEETAIRQRTPSDRKKLDKREKAINALMGIGLSRTDAEQQIDRGMRERK